MLTPWDTTGNLAMSTAVIGFLVLVPTAFVAALYDYKRDKVLVWSTGLILFVACVYMSNGQGTP